MPTFRAVEGIHNSNDVLDEKVLRREPETGGRLLRRSGETPSQMDVDVPDYERTVGTETAVMNCLTKHLTIWRRRTIVARDSIAGIGDVKIRVFTGEHAGRTCVVVY